MIYAGGIFGAILLRSALLKSPGYNKRGVRGARSPVCKNAHTVPWVLHLCRLEGGMKTAVMMTAVNSLGNQNSRHRSMGYSRSGVQRDCIGCAFLRSHHYLLIMKHTPPTLLFPGRSGILSAGCMKKPIGSMVKSGTFSRHPGFYEANNRAIPDLTLERNLRFQEIRTLSSQSLLSRDWTLASRIFGSSGRSVRSLNLPRTPALFPLLRLNFWHRGRAAQAKGCL